MANQDSIDLKQLSLSELIGRVMSLEIKHQTDIKRYDNSSSSVVIEAREEYLKKFNEIYTPLKEEIDRRERQYLKSK